MPERNLGLYEDAVRETREIANRRQREILFASGQASPLIRRHGRLRVLPVAPDTAACGSLGTGARGAWRSLYRDAAEDHFVSSFAIRVGDPERLCLEAAGDAEEGNTPEPVPHLLQRRAPVEPCCQQYRAGGLPETLGRHILALLVWGVSRGWCRE